MMAVLMNNICFILLFSVLVHIHGKPDKLKKVHKGLPTYIYDDLLNYYESPQDIDYFDDNYEYDYGSPPGYLYLEDYLYDEYGYEDEDLNNEPYEPEVPKNGPDRIFFPGEYVSPPKISPQDFYCGYVHTCGFYMAVLSNMTYVPMYRLNDTAENLKNEGYEIHVHNLFVDAISNMTYCKNSICETISYERWLGASPVGGEPAERERSQYMAQLGERKGNKTIFLCDGVIINPRWVLSAAHCFMNPSYDLNVVRMGDYDGSRLVKDPNAKYEFRTFDFPIADVIFYPDYHPKIRYHDLALILLPQRTPEFASTIVPVCLPWDYINENFEGKEVVLTGWGATAYGGTRTNILQQVKLRVENPSVCQKSYSKLFGFKKKHPDGLTFENILCVGADEEGKDACNGDSGGPLVLGYGQCRDRERFILVGIVSGGFGCGLKKYPGLYIPINKPKYLQWIKEVAFKDYESCTDKSCLMYDM